MFMPQLILLVLVLPQTSSNRIEASEVEALFLTPSSNEENSDEAETETKIGSNIKEKITSAETEIDASVNTTADHDRSEEFGGGTRIMPAADLSDRRSWHVPISGGDVIAPAIIPPEPEDMVTEETITDSAIVAINDPRNWHVLVSGGDSIPQAILPPEQGESTVMESTDASEVKHSGSNALKVSASLLLPIVFLLYL